MENGKFHLALPCEICPISNTTLMVLNIYPKFHCYPCYYIYAICTTCQVEVSRDGGSTKSYTTTNIVSHLAKHPEVNKQYFERKSAKEAPTSKVTRKRKIEQQLLLEEM